uniref:deoxyhypusine synthase n=1 Tax=Arcella intermedia TaxID=1963864 RepID=A0A6B2L799_9EUKA
MDWNGLLGAYKVMGFQASALGKAIEEVNRMIRWRMIDDPIKEDEVEPFNDPAHRAKVRCTIFLGYTSNMISCGVREIIRYLVQNQMVDCIVTTAGGIEEDFIKCMANTYNGDFHIPGETLRRKGVNRIGNLLIPNENYCKFEDWIMPILDQMLVEQKQKNKIWSPSKIIRRLGREINNEESVYYWCWKNKIPVFCPALTDGSLGDMIYVHSFKNPGLIVDIAQDIRKLNSLVVWAKKSGIIILGGGIVKHHICNSNMLRNGAEFAVFINTGQEFDGSDSGARPDEAVSWGKISLQATPVKVYCDASIAFPLVVAMTFAQHFEPKPPVIRKNKTKK